MVMKNLMKESWLLFGEVKMVVMDMQLKIWT